MFKLSFDEKIRKSPKYLTFLYLTNFFKLQVLTNDKLDERLLLCKAASDMPEWWIPGKHDKDLIQGVARHGLARMDYYVLNDPELSFKDILKRHLCNEPLLDKKAAKDYEKAREKLKAENEKSESDKEDNDKDEDEKDKDDEKKAKKARRVSVSVAPPQITLQQMEQMAKGGIIYDMDMMNDLMAQTYASAVKWPKDQILAIRVEHIVKCVISGKYPVEKGHSLGEILAELQDTDNVPFDSKNPDSNLRESSSTPAGSESSDLSRKNESKIRQLLTSGQITKYDENEDDPVSR